MSAPKSAAALEQDPVIAAIENAPLDPEILTPEEAEAVDAQIAASRARYARGEVSCFRQESACSCWCSRDTAF